MERNDFHEAWVLLERLAEPEGATVIFMCENPEGSGPDNHAIEVNDAWTDWKDQRFTGRTRLDALRSAAAAKDARSI